MPTYTCLCCGHIETFETAEAADAASWDVAPYFTLQPLCDWCLSAPILSRKLPRQVDSAKGDWPVDDGLGKKVRGGTRPRLSCGRSLL